MRSFLSAMPCRRLFLIVTSLALLLSACGTEDGEEGTESASDGEPQDAEQDGAEEDGEQESFSLNAANYAPAGPPSSEAMDWFAEQIEERTDGGVTFEVHHANSLCPGPEILQCVSDGRADMGAVATVYTPGDFPLVTVGEIPFLIETPEVLPRLLHDAYEERQEFEDEWNQLNQRPLSYATVDQMIVGLKEPIDGVDGLEGLSIRGGGGYLDRVLEAVGVNSVALTGAELYEAIERGVVDGGGTAIDGMVAWQLHEVTDYWYTLGTGTWTTIAYTINNDVWESLPEDYQQVFLDVHGELMDSYNEEFYIPAKEQYCGDAMAQLEEFSEMPEDDVEDWEAEIGTSIEEDWVETAEGAGYENATEVLEWTKDRIGSLEDDLSDQYRSTAELCNEIASS